MKVPDNKSYDVIHTDEMVELGVLYRRRLYLTLVRLGVAERRGLASVPWTKATNVFKPGWY